ncbi:MAG: hypothetical protein JWM97_2235 [Phycisphaerales bacterium]|nr:hypothetical protein [Phycisphaerales bacterium]
MKHLPSGILDYSQRPSPEPMRFRYGFVSLVLSAFLFASEIVLDRCGSRIPPSTFNAILIAIAWAYVLSLGLGIGGLFQIRGKLQAILGIAVSLLNLIVLPALLVA